MTLCKTSSFFQGLYQLLEPKVTIRCRKQDVQSVQVSLCCRRLFPEIRLMPSRRRASRLFAGFHPEELAHLQGCREEQPGGPHRPRQLPRSGHVSVAGSLFGAFDTKSK